MHSPVSRTWPPRPPPRPRLPAVRLAGRGGADGAAALRRPLARDLRAALDTAEAVAARHFQPHNRKADLEEPRLENGRVVVVPGGEGGAAAFADAGFFAMEAAPEAGGMALPHLVAGLLRHFRRRQHRDGLLPAADHRGANLIESFGSADQKRRYLPAMRAGRFFGTMALTEPQAGSSPGRHADHGRRRPDGSYRLKGNKIFISGGDHELSDNIVHLVLAGSPARRPGPRASRCSSCRSSRSPTTARSAAQRRGAGRPVPQDGLARHHLDRAELRRERACVGELVGEPHAASPTCSR
jgi:hypothetical protein